MLAEITQLPSRFTVISTKSTFVNTNDPKLIKIKVEFHEFASDIHCANGSAIRNTQSVTVKVPCDEYEMNGIPTVRMSNA
jgi:hypothetical protein